MSDKSAKTGRFLPGNSGFGGRPKGSRNKLQESFWKDFAEAWDKHGQSAFEHVAANDQSTFVRVAASLMPKEAEITLRKVVAAELSDDELAGIIRARSSNGASQAQVDPSQLN